MVNEQTGNIETATLRSTGEPVSIISVEGYMAVVRTEDGQRMAVALNAIDYVESLNPDEIVSTQIQQEDLELDAVLRQLSDEESKRINQGENLLMEDTEWTVSDISEDGSRINLESKDNSKPPKTLTREQFLEARKNHRWQQATETEDVPEVQQSNSPTVQPSNSPTVQPSKSLSRRTRTLPPTTTVPSPTTFPERPLTTSTDRRSSD